MCGTYLGHKTVLKTRRPHRCFGCGRRIPKGTRAETVRVANDGTVSTTYTCLDCSEFEKTPNGRAAAEDDGCLWPDCFADEPYARFPILEPVADATGNHVNKNEGGMNG